MKKAQAAMEFLLTYGWAIVIVVTMISALAYFGVLDPKKLAENYAPQQCIIETGLSCLDHNLVYFTPFPSGPEFNYLELSLKNTMGADITIDRVEFPTYGTVFPTSGSLNYNLYNDQKTPKDNPLELTAITPAQEAYQVDETYKLDFVIYYNNSLSGLWHASKGTVRGKVKSS